MKELESWDFVEMTKKPAGVVEHSGKSLYLRAVPRKGELDKEPELVSFYVAVINT